MLTKQVVAHKIAQQSIVRDSVLYLEPWLVVLVQQLSSDQRQARGVLTDVHVIQGGGILRQETGRVLENAEELLLPFSFQEHSVHWFYFCVLACVVYWIFLFWNKV